MSSYIRLVKFGVRDMSGRSRYVRVDMEPPELVALVKERLGIATDADLALTLWPGQGEKAVKRVRRWSGTKNKPPETKPYYDDTLLLLRTAGLLREEPATASPDHPARQARADGDLDSLLEELEAAAERIQAVMRELRAERKAPPAPRGSGQGSSRRARKSGGPG
jgi:hypothetical protein